MRRILGSVCIVFLGSFICGLISYSILNVSGSAIERRIATCERTSETYLKCIRSKLSTIITHANVFAVMKSVEASFGDTIDKEILCHDVGHIVGEVAGEKSPYIGSLIASCGDGCGYGCAHGVLAGRLRANPDMIRAPDALCRSNGDQMNVRDAIACHHGVGHAAAELGSYRLTDALEFCQGFSEFVAREECATGVFMEIYNAPTKSHPPSIITDQGADICADVHPEFYEICVRRIAGITYVVHNDIHLGMDICRKLTDTLMTKCIIGLGSDVYYRLGGDPSAVAAVCIDIGTDDMRTCFEGAVRTAILEGRIHDGAVALCALAPVGWRPTCNSMAEKGAPVL